VNFVLVSTVMFLQSRHTVNLEHIISGCDDAFTLICYSIIVHTTSFKTTFNKTILHSTAEIGITVTKAHPNKCHRYIFLECFSNFSANK